MLCGGLEARGRCDMCVWTPTPLLASCHCVRLQVQVGGRWYDLDWAGEPGCPRFSKLPRVGHPDSAGEQGHGLVRQPAEPARTGCGRMAVRCSCRTMHACHLIAKPIRL